MTIAIVVTAAFLTTGSRASNANRITGEYVEARTASVFAGACHYNGELVTTGRDALMAWNVKSGSWDGVDLSGVRALAIVSSNANLAEKGERRTELIINSEATYAQTIAMVNALKAEHPTSLGKVVAVKQAPLSFVHEAKSYSVQSNDTASIDVVAMTDDLCCTMPQLVWYTPLVSLQSRKVGYTRKANYSGGVVGEPWERTGENSAFYGSFEF